MKKHRITAIILTAFTLVQMLSLAIAADAKNEYAAVTEAVPVENMFVGGALDSAADAENWSANG